MRIVVCSLPLWLAAALSCESTNEDPDLDGGTESSTCFQGRVELRHCYSGPDGTEGVGACHRGDTVECRDDDWVCMSEVLPAEEVCDGIDNDCDGEVDEEPRDEVCDYRDNDCDGEVDEGVRNACGDCSACELPGDHPAPVVRCGPALDAADAGPGADCELPPSECDGRWLIYWSNGVCAEGTCRYEQHQVYCTDGCYDGGCQESFT